jgi:hypothetical protein
VEWTPKFDRRWADSLSYKRASDATVTHEITKPFDVAYVRLPEFASSLYVPALVNFKFVKVDTLIFWSASQAAKYHKPAISSQGASPVTVGALALESEVLAVSIAVARFRLLDKSNEMQSMNPADSAFSSRFDHSRRRTLRCMPRITSSTHHEIFGCNPLRCVAFIAAAHRSFASQMRWLMAQNSR